MVAVFPDGRIGGREDEIAFVTQAGDQVAKLDHTIERLTFPGEDLALVVMRIRPRFKARTSYMDEGQDAITAHVWGRRDGDWNLLFGMSAAKLKLASDG